MDIEQYKNIYFLGIGGIGMSALARYFHQSGKHVFGYDRIPSPITNGLEALGIAIHYDDTTQFIEQLDSKDLLVVWTPAIPDSLKLYQYLKAHPYTMLKRAEVLGLLTCKHKGVGVAGTHGKTTVSTFVAHLLRSTGVNSAAFLGGISKNYNTNYLAPSSTDNPYVVMEADEYDRSFLQLYPYIAIITATDPDHLDIYGTAEEFLHTFDKYIGQINKGGYLLAAMSAEIDATKHTHCTIYRYAYKDAQADFYATNLERTETGHRFTFVSPQGRIDNVDLNYPGHMNIENCVAAMGVATLLGAEKNKIREGVKTFEGIKRRFEYHINTPQKVYIDDYAHHPKELKACISSVKDLYPDKRVVGVFQPHLFSRTKDFHLGFAKSLSLLDKVYLLDIYPAREEPIEGVTSQLILDNITDTEKQYCTKEQLPSLLEEENPEVLLTLGAGDIGLLVNQIKALWV